MDSGRAALIGLDWGTSRLRAYLFDPCGAVLAWKDRPWGVRATAGGFPAAYHEIVADRRERRRALRVIAAGMITKALQPQGSLDFLSGLLIGDEVRAALGAVRSKLALTGEPALCERYVRALGAFATAAPVVEGADEFRRALRNRRTRVAGEQG